MDLIDFILFMCTNFAPLEGTEKISEDPHVNYKLLL